MLGQAVKANKLVLVPCSLVRCLGMQDLRSCGCTCRAPGYEAILRPYCSAGAEPSAQSVGPTV